MTKKGFTLVELMVVVAIIAILAAVALPMYTRFKQKAAAFGPIKVVSGLTAALQGHYGEYGTFQDVDFGPAGKKLVYNAQIDVGSNIVPIDGVNYLIEIADDTELKISWSWTVTRCPDPICGGMYCLNCENDGTGCRLAIQLNTPVLGLNRSTDPTYTSC